MEVTEQGSEDEHIEVSYTYKDMIKAKGLLLTKTTPIATKQKEKGRRSKTEKILRMTKTEILQIEILQI